MSMQQKIYQVLKTSFPDAQIDVRDDSEAHRGHAGYQEGGESHFSVTLQSGELMRLSRVARHRAVHKALGPDIISSIHALALDVRD